MQAGEKGKHRIKYWFCLRLPKNMKISLVTRPMLALEHKRKPQNTVADNKIGASTQTKSYGMNADGNERTKKKKISGKSTVYMNR